MRRHRFTLASEWRSARRLAAPWVQSRSNCPRTGAESRPLSSQVHLKTCQMAAKAAKCLEDSPTPDADTGLDCYEIQSEASSLACARRSAGPGARDRELLRRGRHDQLPGAR